MRCDGSFAPPKTSMAHWRFVMISDGSIEENYFSLRNGKMAEGWKHGELALAREDGVLFPHHSPPLLCPEMYVLKSVTHAESADRYEIPIVKKILAFQSCVRSLCIVCKYSREIS